MAGRCAVNTERRLVDVERAIARCLLRCYLHLHRRYALEPDEFACLVVESVQHALADAYRATGRRR